MKRIVWTSGIRFPKQDRKISLLTNGERDKTKKSKNLLIYLIGSIFIVGVLLGSTVVYRMNLELYQYFYIIIEEMVQTSRESQWYSNFSAILLPSMMYMIVLFLCGFCVIAQPIILFIPFARGVGFGLLQVGLLSTMYGKGDWITYGITLPLDLLICIILFFACKQSFLLSKRFWIQTKKENSRSDSADILFYIRIYLLRYLLYVGVTLCLCFTRATVYSIISIIPL